jgi:LPXTG-site transpeptidase (sortase) family protein
MRGRVFLFLFSFATILVVGSHPAVLGAVIPVASTPTQRAATATPTVTITPTRTPDPLAGIPTTTPIGGGAVAAYVPAWPSPAMGMAPPTFTPTPFSINTPIALETRESPPVILPESAIIPTPAGPAPDRLQISHLNLDVPIEPVGLVPSPAIAGGYEWEVPAWRAAGWLSSSAPFGASGNTVLDGHHNIDGEVFRDLWTLQRGDDIVLWAGNQARDYRVDEVLILPERDQPRAVRLANARYIQPTDDERLTLITCWPYEDNSHRAVVVAKVRER